MPEVPRQNCLGQLIMALFRSCYYSKNIFFQIVVSNVLLLLIAFLHTKLAISYSELEEGKSANFSEAIEADASLVSYSKPKAKRLIKPVVYDK